MKLDLKHYSLPIFATVILFLIIGFSIFTRAQGLGYSNFQGDEVDTVDFIYFMESGPEGVWNYLISKKRGPVQYLFNITHVSLLGFHDELQIRFPYLIFGIIAIYVIYRFAKKIYDPTTALFAATLLGLNGLFIAFSRITQYQSMMYVILPIGIMLFINALNRNSRKLLIISGLVMSIALLLHYDTLSTLAFFISGFLAHFIRTIYADKKELNIATLFHEIGKNKKLLMNYFGKLLIFLAAFIIPAMFYYAPFYMGQAFESKTSGYLEQRLSGGGFMPRTDMTTNLMTVYMPEYYLNLLFVSGIVGILLNVRNIVGAKLAFLKFNKRKAQLVFGFFTLLILASTIFSFYPIKPRSSSLLIIGSSVVISLLLVLYNKVKWERAALVTWFLGSYSFYLFVMKDPRTHVYIAMIPLFVLAGYGIARTYTLIKFQWLKSTALSLLLLFFVIVSGINWAIFIDKTPEYLWWDKDFLGWPIYRIERVRHKKIEGVFGLNNYRGWEVVGDLYKRGCIVGSYNSNEKNSITFFYTGINQLKGHERGFVIDDADTIVIIEGSDSWEYVNHEKTFKGTDYQLLGRIYSGDTPMSYIYGKNSVYPEGKFLCNQ